jgi:hypothetical protein
VLREDLGILCDSVPTLFVYLFILTNISRIFNDQPHRIIKYHSPIGPVPIHVKSDSISALLAR